MISTEITVIFPGISYEITPRDLRAWILQQISTGNSEVFPEVLPVNSPETVSGPGRIRLNSRISSGISQYIAPDIPTAFSSNDLSRIQWGILEKERNFSYEYLDVLIRDFQDVWDFSKNFRGDVYKSFPNVFYKFPQKFF